MGQPGRRSVEKQSPARGAGVSGDEAMIEFGIRLILTIHASPSFPGGGIAGDRTALERGRSLGTENPAAVGSRVLPDDAIGQLGFRRGLTQQPAGVGTGIARDLAPVQPG